MEKEEENMQPVTGEKRSPVQDNLFKTTQPAKKPKKSHPDESIQSKEQCKRYALVTSFNKILASSHFA